MTSPQPQSTGVCNRCSKSGEELWVWSATIWECFSCASGLSTHLDEEDVPECFFCGGKTEPQTSSRAYCKTCSEISMELDLGQQCQNCGYWSDDITTGWEWTSTRDEERRLYSEILTADEQQLYFGDRRIQISICEVCVKAQKDNGYLTKPSNNESIPSRQPVNVLGGEGPQETCYQEKPKC